MKLPILQIVVSLALITVSQGSLTFNLTFNHDGINYDKLFNSAWKGKGSAANSDKKATFEYIMRSAAKRWEYAFEDSSKNLTLNVNVGWGTAHVAYMTGGPPNGGAIRFNKNQSFYLDKSIQDTGDWKRFRETSANLGGGDINVARLHHNYRDDKDIPSLDPMGKYDAFSTALHELGHMVGIGSRPYYELDPTYDPKTYNPKTHKGKLVLSDGSEVAYYQGHTDFKLPGGEPWYYSWDDWEYHPTTMARYGQQSIRRDLTELDIRIAQSIHGFDNVKYDLVAEPYPIPEPSSTFLLGLGSIALILRRKK